jgi:hypothetical protein
MNEVATIIESHDAEGQDVTWKDVGDTPSKFKTWLVRHLAVDVSRIISLFPIFSGAKDPKGADIGKLHIQNTQEPRIGVSTPQGYKYFDRYPRNVIFGWRGGAAIPSFFTQVSDVELELLGLPRNKPNSLVWVVYPE